MNRPIYIVAGIMILAIGGYVAWWLASPLFLDQTVDEAFPVSSLSIEELSEMSAEEIEALPEDVRAQAEEMMQATAEAMPDTMVEDDMPAAEPVSLSMGAFLGADDFHQGEGIATIYQLPDGEQVLRFEEFNVTNGPDLHVLLSTSADPFNDLGEYIDLGQLKGNMGNQNYTIPADVDISQYQSIVIYCMPFHVNFAAATLN